MGTAQEQTDRMETVRKLPDDHIARTVQDIAIRPNGEPLGQDEVDILMEASRRLMRGR